MGAKKAPPTEAETPFEFLLACASAATKERLRAALAGDQEKLFLILLRTLNPVEHLNNPEEGTLRGIKDRNTIGKLKSEGSIPQEPGAVCVTVQK
jgi:hypothetical protein